MKKALLVTLDFWPKTGGVATYYTSLLNEIKSFEASVLTIPIVESLFQKDINATQPKIRVIRKSFFFRYFWPRWFLLFFILLKLQRKENFDFFLVGDILPIGTVVWLLTHVVRKPYVVFIHGTDITLSQKSWCKRFLSERILHNAVSIIANSECTKKEICLLNVDKSKITIIHPGLPMPLFSLSSSLPNPLVEMYRNTFVILSICRLVERKGIQYILEALKFLIPKYPQKNIMYAIIGVGPYEKFLQEKVSFLGMTKRVLFLKNISDQEKFLWLHRSDLFVLTSLGPKEANSQNILEDYEGFGIVYLEAGFCGKAVIASDSGGVSEAVLHKETGILIHNPKNQEEVKNALESLIIDENLRNQLGKNARARVLKLFFWNHLAQKFEQILQSKNVC